MEAWKNGRQIEYGNDEDDDMNSMDAMIKIISGFQCQFVLISNIL